MAGESDITTGTRANQSGNDCVLVDDEEAQVLQGEIGRAVQVVDASARRADQHVHLAGAQ